MPRRTLGPPRPCLVPALATMQHHCKAVLGAYAEIICICRRIPNAPARPAIILMPRAYVYTHTHRAYTRNIHSHVRYQTLRRVLPLMPRAYVYTHTHIREIYTPHVRYPVYRPIRMFTTFLVLPIAYSRDDCMDSVMPVLLVTAHTT